MSHSEEKVNSNQKDKCVKMNLVEHEPFSVQTKTKTIIKSTNWLAVSLQNQDVIQHEGISVSMFRGWFSTFVTLPNRQWYLQKMRQVLKSKLNGKNKIQAINTNALPVIRYPTGIIFWPLREMQATDVEKLLTIHGRFHPRSSTLRMYLKQEKGSWGLVSVRATIQEETASLQEYTKKMAPTDDLLSERLRQLKPSMED